DGVTVPVEERLTQLAARVFWMRRLVHVDVDMGADDAHRSTQVRWRWEVRVRGIVRCAIIPVQWFRRLFQGQGHSHFSLRSLASRRESLDCLVVYRYKWTSIGTIILCLSHYTKTGFGATDIRLTACQLSAILAQKPASGSLLRAVFPDQA